MKPPNLKPFDKLVESLHDIRSDLYAVASVALFATDHPIAGSICILMIFIFTCRGKHHGST